MASWCHAISPRAEGPSVTLDLNAEGEVQVDGQTRTAELRTPEVSEATSILSALPAVRDRSNALQRQVVHSALKAQLFSGVIIEGRDIGTVVFPEARCKFYLTASPRVRAERRFRELAPEMLNLTLEDTLRDQEERDRRDETRETAPLKPATDAILVDTTSLDPGAVIDTLLGHIQA